MTWRAHIEEGRPYDLSVRLHVFQRHADGRVDVLMPDATLQRVEEGTEVPDDAGLAIPRAALRAVAEVFHPHATGQARLEADVARLEEVLHHERSRVDRILNRALEH